MTFEGYGSVISNHQSFVDILAHHYIRLPCHVAKEGTKKIPIVGAIT
jgi:1-acyl-sn-glycerol-3-phosphate acyltransferase